MSRLRPMLAPSVLALLCLGGSLALSASAQDRSSPVRPPSGDRVPSGSYQQSCRGANMNGNILSAQCTGPTGAPVYSSIDTNGCRGRDISNDAGYLRCNAGGPRPPEPPRPQQPPSGSYQQSCRGIDFNGSTLRAQCTNVQGRPVSSSLDTNGCRGQDIYNDDGYLRCGSGPRPPVPPGPTPPDGSGAFEAIVYTSAGFRGQSMTIREPIANLGNFRGFNDNIRSIRLVRGRAQVCEDSRYRGRCVRLERSYLDLNTVGMANRISSIR